MFFMVFHHFFIVVSSILEAFHGFFSINLAVLPSMKGVSSMARPAAVCMRDMASASSLLEHTSATAAVHITVLEKVVKILAKRFETRGFSHDFHGFKTFQGREGLGNASRSMDSRPFCLGSRSTRAKIAKNLSEIQ